MRSCGFVLPVRDVQQRGMSTLRQRFSLGQYVQSTNDHYVTELAALTFSGMNHLNVYCRGDDGLGKIQQVPTQTITQDWKFQMIQVC